MYTINISDTLVTRKIWNASNTIEEDNYTRMKQSENIYRR